MSRPLIEALRQMRAALGKVKHVILITDGVTADNKSYDYMGLIAAYAESGVTISTIGIGGDAAKDFLKAIALGTGGEFYYVRDTSTLPLIVINDTKRVLDKSGFLEEAFTPRIEPGSEILKGIRQEQIPRILGYIPAKAKRGAEVALYTEIRGLRDPLLATWRWGLGKTVAFTTDAEARWSREMVSWRMFGKFWTQVLRWAMRERSREHYFVRYRERGEGGYLELNTFSGVGKKASFRIELPGAGNLKKRILNLHQAAPSTYVGEVGTLPPRVDSVIVEKIEGGKLTDRKEVALVRRKKAPLPSRESKTTGNNMELLGKIAAAAGGRLNPGAEEMGFQPELVPVRKSLVAWLVPFIFAFLLADIAARKLGV